MWQRRRLNFKKHPGSLMIDPGIHPHATFTSPIPELAETFIEKFSRSPPRHSQHLRKDS